VGLGALSAAAAAVLVILVAWGAWPFRPDTGPAPGAAGTRQPTGPRVGLITNDPRAFPGYTLFAPSFATTTHLIDMQGRVVRTWEADCTPWSVYLLEDGHLLRGGHFARQPDGTTAEVGRVQEYTWEGDLVWDFAYGDDKRRPHHDLCKLPNGNVLMIVSERKTEKEALAAGRRPGTTAGDNLLPDCLVEVRPTGPTAGKVVWEWHAWDHLVQDADPARANYGNVREHPERIDVNAGGVPVAASAAVPRDLDPLRTIGYVGDATPGANQATPEWTHTNAVCYNAEFDQVMVTVREFGEVWVIDHGTTTAEAAGHTGGRHGKGGDLLYRWGNPVAYRAGTARDQKLFGPHSGHWIPRGRPGAGHILVFNNGRGRTAAAYSTVEEVVPPVGPDGRYRREPGAAFGPDAAVWSYAAPEREEDFFALLASGAERLPNGNTLVTGGTNGMLFEVTPARETVWLYVNPVPGGPQALAVRRPLGEVLPPVLQDRLHFTARQKERLAELHGQVAARLGRALTDRQRDLLRHPRADGPGGSPRPGQVLPPATAEELGLTAEQKRKLDEVQKEADAGLDHIFTEDQRKQFQGMLKAFDRGRPPAPPPGAAGAIASNVFPGAFGLQAGGAVFRAYRYGPDYPGLKGKDLTPGPALEGPPKGPSKK
jgi:hypothetical protein